MHALLAYTCVYVNAYLTPPTPSRVGRRASSGALATLCQLMRTIVYVDGFNLYYGAIKGTRFKWLDLPLLFEKVLKPHHNIELVRYFTAKVSSTSSSPYKSQNQGTYLHALRKYSPNVEIHLGHFLQHTVRLPLAHPTAKHRNALVIKIEEKGSDVNLAVHLLNDALHGACDCAVVVTNDSDIAEAMRLVKRYTTVCVGLVTPGNRRTSNQLRRHADFVRHIRGGALAQSQLPNPIPNTGIHKPKSW